jgi:hypothetical protein
MERRRRFTVGGVMVLIAFLSLVMALIVQTRRAAEREARDQAEIAHLRMQLIYERLPEILAEQNHRQAEIIYRHFVEKSVNNTNIYDFYISREGSTMPRGRRQFTLGWLMGGVAVCGFEAFLYMESAKQKAALNLATSITDNIYLYSFGRMLCWVVVWVVSSRLRPAISVATNQGDQVSDSGGTNA